MSSIVALAGSPSTGSRTVALLELLAGWLRADGHEVRVIPVRALPAEALLGADAGDPLLTGGAPVHALAVDYALRPVLTALGARHVVPGNFVLDKQIERTPDGVVLAPDARSALGSAVAEFATALPVTARVRR